MKRRNQEEEEEEVEAEETVESEEVARCGFPVAVMQKKRFEAAATLLGAFSLDIHSKPYSQSSKHAEQMRALLVIVFAAGSHVNFSYAQQSSKPK